MLALIVLNNRVLLYYIIIIVINLCNIWFNLDQVITLNILENSGPMLAPETAEAVEGARGYRDSLDENNRYQLYTEDGVVLPNTVPMFPTLSLYDKVRKFTYWKIIGKYTGEFASYNNYKFRWDPRCYSIRSDVKSGVKNGIYTTYIKNLK